MTENQKYDIVRMRRSGKTYRSISERLGISINSVKSYCRRNNVKVNADPENDSMDKNGQISSGDSCLNCGKIIVQREKTKKRKFCCKECRERWWNSHPEEVNRRAVYKKACAFCDKEFAAYGNNHRKYCSHSCYISARFGG